MNSNSLIADMEQKANSQDSCDQYAALLFALQIPSICSRIEIPKNKDNTGKDKNNPKILYNEKTGKPFDKNLYFAWLRKHSNSFIKWGFSLMPFDLLCASIYNLRNQVTHSGSLLELNTQIVLVDSIYGCMFSGKTLYMSLYEFCSTMFSAARDVFSTGVWSQQVSLADDNMVFQTLSINDFNEIQRELETTYRDFWQDRNADLKLYQDYCFYLLGQLDIIKENLAKSPQWSIGNLTRDESERLVEIVEECDAFGDKLDSQIANKYFKRK